MVNTKTRTLKRRVIYMDDDTWRQIKTESEKHGLTMSAWIRERIDGRASSSVAKEEPVGFNTRPFTPVPKKK